MNRFRIEHNTAHIHVQLTEHLMTLSSAVLNGGLVKADHILNLRVAKNCEGEKGASEPSVVTLEKYSRMMDWKGVTVGMMTAADAESFRNVKRVEQKVEVRALVTAGITNARRAGDPADCRDMGVSAPANGTINIIILTDAILTPAAMVEAVSMVAEAKSAALQNLDIRNPETGSLATGTGTDAVAIVSGNGPSEIRYCGKHTLFGEMLAATVIEAITSSLQ